MRNWQHWLRKTQDEDKTHNKIGIGHQTSSNYKHARFECGRSWVRTTVWWNQRI